MIHFVPLIKYVPPNILVIIEDKSIGTIIMRVWICHTSKPFYHVSRTWSLSNMVHHIGKFISHCSEITIEIIIYDTWMLIWSASYSPLYYNANYCSLATIYFRSFTNPLFESISSQCLLPDILFFRVRFNTKSLAISKSYTRKNNSFGNFRLAVWLKNSSSMTKDSSWDYREREEEEKREA